MRKTKFGRKLSLHEYIYRMMQGVFEQTPPPDPLEGIDVIEEYKLVQLKKSKLSRSLRDEVVTRYTNWKAEHEKTRKTN